MTHDSSDDLAVDGRCPHCSARILAGLVFLHRLHIRFWALPMEIATPVRGLWQITLLCVSLQWHRHNIGECGKVRCLSKNNETFDPVKEEGGRAVRFSPR